MQAAASDRAGHLVAASKFLRVFLQIAILGTGAYLTIEQESTPGSHDRCIDHHGARACAGGNGGGKLEGIYRGASAYNKIMGLFSILPAETEKLPLPAPEGHFIG